MTIRLLPGLIGLVSTGLCVGVPMTAHGQPAATMSTPREPADVFARVAVVRAELELIRREMGRPPNEQLEIGVFDAEPREVFFQALTLFRKADRLCFEQARQRAPVPEPPVGDIEPGHVYEVVDLALERLRIVKAELGIVETAFPASHAADMQPPDVLRSIVQANRQLNLLLEQRFSPSDVYQQVTVAISHGAQLLGRFPGARQIPPTPAFERYKRPADVYRRLVGCFDLVRQIAQTSDVPILDLTVRDDEVLDVTPSDVYDIASLLVSELAYLRSRLPVTAPPIDSYYPGRKFPSDVYQRVGVLEAQLTHLLARVEAWPAWLRTSPSP